jgi:hypothetical protein
MARKKKTAKVEDNPELERDLSTNAIINTSMTAYQIRLNQIEKAKLDVQQTEDIVQLKKDVEEIKTLLQEIASK